MFPTALFVLYPYLTIHMRELGISVEETAVMNAVTPVIAIIMPPLAGMVADRIGNFRVSILFCASWKIIEIRGTLVGGLESVLSFCPCLYSNLSRLLMAVCIYQHYTTIAIWYGTTWNKAKTNAEKGCILSSCFAAWCEHSRFKYMQKNLKRGINYEFWHKC